jgi:hypothetical protein
MFQTFTGREYLKIDIANNFGAGLDKLDWNSRIAWFDQHEGQLNALVKQAEEPALFYAGVAAWQKMKEGKSSGYPISLDATSSGIQILACLAGDRKAAELCNVIDTGRREDAYTSLYEHMVNEIADTAKIDRKQTKQAIMTSFYGSTAMPKNIFGEGELLDVFYKTMQERAPGAWEINETMLAIWDDKTLVNEWVMPDNFHVVVKVMNSVSENVHFLNQPFEVSYSVNEPIENGRSLGANVVHSIDGMIVREMARRCSFDLAMVERLENLIRRCVKTKSTHRAQDDMVLILWGRYLESGFLSARILDYLDEENFGLVDRDAIVRMLNSLPRKPFDVISVHDCFRCLPNYGNDLRQQYNNLLAEIAESEMLSFLVSQIVHRPVQVAKLDPTLARDVRSTNYALS